MRRFVLVALGLALGVSPALAQPEEDEPAGQEPAGDEADAADDEDEDLPPEDLPPEDDEPRLRAPELEPIDVPLEPDTTPDEPALTSPGDAASLLEDAAPPSSDPTDGGWTAPQSVFTLHGYFRVRGELQDTFFLGRDDERDLPFSLFRPIDRGAVPFGGCRGEPEPDLAAAEPCGNSDRLRFANMRLRLEPTLSLSDDVHVHMMIDVLDNVVLGSNADGQVWLPPGAPGGSGDGFVRPERTPGVPLDSFSATSNPPEGLRNGIQDSIRVRRAWAQVTNRGLGQLRFGRMGSHWGLGLLANDGTGRGGNGFINYGRGIDADQSSDVDRIMGITKLAGFYLIAAWDFASEGFIRYDPADLRAVPYDATQKDDIRQFVFATARRMDEEDQRDRLQRGDWVLNGGFYFVLRRQSLSSAAIDDPFAVPESAARLLTRRRARAYIPDLWMQFLWRDLRLEMEAVLIAGSVENIENGSYTEDDFNILQFGVAAEAEYRLLDDRLGLSLYTGYATGDPDVEGLSARAGLLAQQPAGVGGRRNDKTISTFQFHPNYRVDLILWRNIMGRVAGAWYMRPGISYDIIRNSFGQLFGARFDIVYSRAAQETQTWGSDPNLGVELNGTLYYRSEDGPEPIDGFYAAFQYGILFPLDGLGYPTFGGVDAVTDPGLNNAQTLRLLLGVQY